MNESGNKTKLELLRDRFGVMVGPFETDEGKAWHPRLKRSKELADDKLADSDELRAFFAEPYRDVNISTPQGEVTIRIKLSLAWSMGKNHVSDLHFTNPEPWIRSRRGRQDRDFDRMLNDVAKAMHDNAKSEEVVKKCLLTGLYQGGGVMAWTFEQEGEYEDAPLLDEYGEQMHQQVPDEETGEMMQTPMFETEEVEEDGEMVTRPRQQFRASSQRAVARFVPLSRCLLDPDGREWDFCDAKYFGWRYKRPLSEIVEDTQHYEKDLLKLLVNAITDSYSSKLASDGDRVNESDPAFIDIEMIELYDKTTLQLLHIPIIAGEIAKFHIGVGEWPRGLKERKKFPFRLVAEDWNPPNKEDTAGIYPVPLLRHARSLIEDIIRLYENFFTAAAKVNDKWIAYEGTLVSNDIVAVMSPDTDSLVTLNAENVRQAFNIGVGTGMPDPDKVMRRLDRGAEKLAQAMGFANAIVAAKNELYEIFGQGPSDRGGVSEGTTATEIAEMSAARDKRTKDAREEIAKAFDHGTEVGFLLLTEYGTLPIPYQQTTSAYGEKRWSEFEIDLLQGLDLVYSHVVDSSRPKNRASERIERKDFLATFIPFVDSKRQKQRLGMWAAEPHDTNGIALQDIFEDPAPEIAKQLLSLQIQIQDDETGTMAANPEVAAEVADLTTQLIQAVLSEADLEEVATGGQAGGGGAIGGAPGAGPKSLTPGQMAAAGAAAGRSTVGA